MSKPRPSSGEAARPGDPGEGRRVMGPWSAMSMVAGSMLGIGIFLTPPIVAGHVSAPAIFFLLWVVGGLAALSGAVAYAELGAMMPKAGGDYVFLREAFGASTAFACGWVIFGAVFTGSIAAMAVPLCQYQLPALVNPLLDALPVAGAWRLDPEAPIFPGAPLDAARALGVALVLAITGLNALGARLSAWVQNLTTIVPAAVFAVGALVVLAVGMPPSSAAEVMAAPTPTAALSAGALASSYMAVYFAYSGWNAVNYVAGEVDRPGRNIPLGLLGGTAAIMALYLLMCAAFIEVLGYGGLKASMEAGTAAATAFGGPKVGWAVTLMIAFGLLGSINGTILGGARVAYAMARDGAFWSGAAKLSERHAVPTRALWIQAAWACAFIVSGSFEALLNLVSLAMIAIGAVTVASVFALRRKSPDVARPYRITGYPWTPAFYLIASALVVAVTIFEAIQKGKIEGWYPLLGLLILPVAFTIHALGARRSRA